jgi:hypothetical protein
VMRLRIESHRTARYSMVSILGLLSALTLTSCGSGSPYVVYLTITPGQSSLAVGETAQFSARASYSNGTTMDVTSSAAWASLAPGIAAVTPGGTATPKMVGSTSVTATVSGMTAFASLNVTKAALTAISVSAPGLPIATGLTAQLKAVGSYTDKTVADITDQVTWAVAQPDVLAVTPIGLVTAKAAGSTGVTASIDKISGSAEITVAPASLTGIVIANQEPMLPLGSSEQLSAMGVYSDGSNADLTGMVIWTTSAPAIIGISGAGLVSAKSVGTAAVTAALSGFSATAALRISDATVVSIAVGIDRQLLPVGETAQVRATGTYTDGSTKDLTGSAVWKSSSPGVVSVNSAGAIVAKAVGSAGVSATASGVTGSTTVLTTEAELVSLAVSAGTATVPLGATLQLTATGSFTDGSTRDLTGTAVWNSSSPDIVAVSEGGLASAVAPGSVAVTAVSGKISGAGSLTVSAPAVSSLLIAPASPTVALGDVLLPFVTAKFTDGSAQDVTSQVAWSIDNPAVATIGTGGAITGLQIGSTAIHASLNGVTADETVTVRPAFGVSYYDTRQSSDSTIRITNPGVTGQDLCALIYVFDQDQQMNECCGCVVSTDGLLTLSLTKNLLSNPLTGVRSAAGTVVLVPAQAGTTGGCNAASDTPAGKILGWSTRLSVQGSGVSSTTEQTFSSSPLSPVDSAALQAECSFIQQLGSGQGVCGCGSEY